MNEKRCFLLESSKLYRKFTYLTENDSIRRFLAFKIILNCMSFEDLVKNRKFKSIRLIRNVFLAHKQKGNYFDAFNAVNLIKSNLIDELISFMESHTNLNEKFFPELNDNSLCNEIFELTKIILESFEKEYFTGVMLNNNFLCAQKGQLSEISSNPISSVFYRYNSSKQLSMLANYFISNVYQYPKMIFVLRNMKIDYVLHAVNMYDCIFKDVNNSYSLKGLYEVLLDKGTVDISALESLKKDSDLLNTYDQLRNVRNKIAGHMDTKMSLTDLLALVDQLDFTNIFNFVNRLDGAVNDTGKKYIYIRAHLMLNKPSKSSLDGLNVEQIIGPQHEPYFS